MVASTAVANGASLSTFVLLETASGYALFQRLGHEEIASKEVSNVASNLDFGTFGKTIKLVSFAPFKSAAHALENMMDVSEGVVNEYLQSFLETNLPKSSKKSSSLSSQFQLGVSEKNLAGSIKQALQCECISDEFVLETVRNLRLFAEKFISNSLASNTTFDLSRAQLGLGHAYSRAKVKFNVNRADNMIIQAICLLDQLDKDVNTFSMRCKEWYGWHFPELVKIVSENDVYAKLVKFILNKSNLSESHLQDLEDIVQDPAKAKAILAAAQASMGTDISAVDLSNIEAFAERVISLTQYRKNLFNYLSSKMETVAPNLSALIGEMVGARLIAHAGSLTNLAKYPASTVQILGAEKALFRALKTKGNTPKYGLIYHSSFISRSSAKNKGRISRFLANKCSIASRIDHFIDTPTDKFGKLLKQQVDDRVKFYEEGGDCMTNEAVMKQALESVAEEEAEMQVDGKPSWSRMNLLEPVKRKAHEDASPSKKSKKKKDDPTDAEKPVVETQASSSPEKKKKKKKKKSSD